MKSLEYIGDLPVEVAAQISVTGVSVGSISNKLAEDIVTNWIQINLPSDFQSPTLGAGPLVNIMISLSTCNTVGSPTIQFLGIATSRRSARPTFLFCCYFVCGTILRFKFMMLAITSIGKSLKDFRRCKVLTKIYIP